MNQEEFKHYGILGMKWGVITKIDKRSSDRKRVDSILSKKPSEMTDQELSDIIRRISSERQVTALTQKPPSIFKRSMTSIGKQLVKPVAKASASVLLNKLIKKNKAKAESDTSEKSKQAREDVDEFLRVFKQQFLK